MRTIEWTGQFKRDFKREAKGAHRRTLDDDVFPVIEDLAKDRPLAPKLRDHALSGNWEQYRECHIKPDLLMMYQKEGADCLRLIRLGSHSELGL